MGRKEALESKASQVGLHVDTYSPGDNLTRYRFFHIQDDHRPDYFAGDGIYTALGIKEAEVFLSGYILAYYHVLENDQDNPAW